MDWCVSSFSVTVMKCLKLDSFINKGLCRSKGGSFIWWWPSCWQMVVWGFTWQEAESMHVTVFLCLLFTTASTQSQGFHCDCLSSLSIALMGAWLLVTSFLNFTKSSYWVHRVHQDPLHKPHAKAFAVMRDCAYNNYEHVLSTYISWLLLLIPWSAFFKKESYYFSEIFGSVQESCPYGQSSVDLLN